MKNILLIIFLSYLSQTNAQQTAFLRVDVKLDKPIPLKTIEGVYLRGNHFFLGDWQHGKIRLKRRDSLTWSGIFILNKGDNILFVIDNGKPLKLSSILDTTNLIITGDTLIQVNYITPDIQPVLPTGDIHNLPRTVEGDLVSRRVIVRTPINYNKDTAKYYPTLYIHDAQYVLGVNPLNKNHWLLKSALDSLENSKLIDPFILVAIDHVFANRSLEYSDSELGDRYRNYVINELIPKIDLQFRTIKESSKRYIAGAVAAGYVSSLIACENSNIIGNVIALSPAYQIADNDYINKVTQDSIWDNKVNYYIDIGEFGMDQVLKPGCDQVVDILKENENPYAYYQRLNTIPDGENFRNRIIPALIHFFKIE